MGLCGHFPFLAGHFLVFSFVANLVAGTFAVQVFFVFDVKLRQLVQFTKQTSYISESIPNNRTSMQKMSISHLE